MTTLLYFTKKSGQWDIGGSYSFDGDYLRLLRTGGAARPEGNTEGSVDYLLMLRNPDNFTGDEQILAGRPHFETTAGHIR